jgi:hypothetical protein
MIKDAVVEEVRNAADKIMSETGYDPMKYIRKLQRNQKKSDRKLVSFSITKHVDILGRKLH